jgi:hypothetical protein
MALLKIAAIVGVGFVITTAPTEAKEECHRFRERHGRE